MTVNTTERTRQPFIRWSLTELISAQTRILVAIMLRDIRTRFVGNHFGFVLSIGWPLSHVLILLAINVGMGRLAPYGDSVALWYAIGVIPFIAFSYMARFLTMGIVLNKTMLVFPRVKITDILFARAIVEILSCGIVILILMLIFWSWGINFIPLNPLQAFLALGAMMLLGLGVGVINSIIAAAIPMWMTVYALFNIIMWILSGVYFVPSSLPAIVQYPLSFNPVIHGIEWMRSAYYEGYGGNFLDKNYLIGFGLVFLFLGLLLERLVRGRLLQQ